jgi:hypothetical protein
MSLDKRRRFAHGYLALMILVSLGYFAWVFGLGRPLILGLPTWQLALMTVFPIVTVISVARETTALRTGRPMAILSRRARLWLHGLASVSVLLSLAIGLMLTQITPAR